MGKLKSSLTFEVEGNKKLFWLETMTDWNGHVTRLCDETLLLKCVEILRREGKLLEVAALEVNELITDQDEEE